MKDLRATLHDYDPGMLPALAEVWGIASKQLRDDEIISELLSRMNDSQVVESVWDQLDEAARAALQLLVSSVEGRMKTAQFDRFYGKIRKMGRGQIQKERPHIAAESIAENLYYRGLIGEGFDRLGEHVVEFVFVPAELVEALPLHKTSFEGLETAPLPEDALPAPSVIDEVRDARPADTTIIDDMVTLLAYLQANPVDIEGAALSQAVVDALLPHLLSDDDNRLDFLLGMAISADLLTARDGRAHPRRDPVRGFLSGARAEQIKALTRAWSESHVYRDLWHVPGLFPDESGWSYDSAAARQEAMSLLGELIPEQGWVSITDLTEIIKEVEPDFQRPDGDYNSWYIRNAAGEFLNGFESWDAVEGALIEFYLLGPMHWLGLMDIGDDVARLTAYGRAFFGFSEWPQPEESAYAIDIRNDGTLLASRRVNRFERFQLARFANWVQSGDPYLYRLDGQSIQRAVAQGINAGHILSFIEKHLDGKRLPIAISKLLRSWQDGARTSLSFESLTVLRTNNEEALDKIFAMPVFRRYLGARLGPMACVIRDGHWSDLQTALGEHGVEVDIAGLREDAGSATEG